MSERVTATQALNLAIEHHNAGRLGDAETIYTNILSALPDHHDALHLLGLVAHERGDHRKAAALIERAVNIEPKIGEMHGNLALVLQDLGRLDEAEICFETALSLSPDFAEGYHNFGLMLQARGNLERALEYFQRAVTIAPDFLEARCHLGDALLENNQPGKAIPHYRKAIEFEASLATAHASLGIALLRTGQAEDALCSLRHAIQLEPDIDTHWIALAAGIEQMRIDAVDETFCYELLSLLNHPAVDPQTIVPAILPMLLAILNDERLFPADPLLLRALTLSPFRELKIEAVLTARRRALLDAPPNALPFACALAQHCFLNEYIFAVTPEEENTVADLANNPTLSAIKLATLACYQPLHRIEAPEMLLKLNWPAPLGPVLQQQIVEPMEECRLRADVATLTPIENSVSEAVRDQYEANPYPRWSRFSTQHTPAPIGNVLCAAPLRFDLDNYRSPDAPEVLIAGCGTGQQPLLAASRYKNARFLAVDLSLSSLTYAMRKTRASGVENIEYAQADILALDGLDRRFDLIECVGVLHHLEDPLKGWRILTERLHQGGVMKIGLYSEIARQDVIAGRLLIAKNGLAPTPKGIRHARKLVAEDPNMESLRTRPSYYSASEWRDLVFHVQEHRFSLPQISNTLKSLGLQFLGFEMRDQQAINAFRAEYGDVHTDLAAWHNFEIANPDTFRGMYQFWVRKY